MVIFAGSIFCNGLESKLSSCSHALSTHCDRFCKCEMPYNPDDLMIQCEECSDWWVNRIFYQDKITFQSHGWLNKGVSAITVICFPFWCILLVGKIILFCVRMDVVSYLFEIRQAVQKGCLCQVEKWIFFGTYVTNVRLWYCLFCALFLPWWPEVQSSDTCVLILACFFVYKWCGSLYSFWFI
jgi:hypothetical protein